MVVLLNPSGSAAEVSEEDEVAAVLVRRLGWRLYIPDDSLSCAYDGTDTSVTLGVWGLWGIMWCGTEPLYS